MSAKAVTTAALVLAVAAGAMPISGASGQQATFEVAPIEIADAKAVFATVESVNVLPARTRIGGTLAEFTVDEGDRVEQGQTIAVVTDETLALRIEAAGATIAALTAEVSQAGIDLARAEDLFARGVLAQARLDEARTAADVVSRQLEEAQAQRAVLDEQVSEGAVIAAAAGRVLSAPVTVGAVVLPGEAVAQIATENYILRLRLPERHARYLETGDAIRVDASSLGGEIAELGEIVQVYPEIADGRVLADAIVGGLGDYFVGERVRVWVSTGLRPAIVIPSHLVSTRYGVDFVTLAEPGGGTVEVAVQLGRAAAGDGFENGIEVLSGLAEGDVLVAAEGH